jgi:hypothetical protein
MTAPGLVGGLRLLPAALRATVRFWEFRISELDVGRVHVNFAKPVFQPLTTFEPMASGVRN